MSKFSVQVQNYQIIEHARLDFENGLNIIVGPSNNGKTAILRAIESAIYNKAGNSFIRHGTEATAVGIKVEDHTVVWRKSADAGMYKVDGQSYNKIGRGQLIEVADALHMSEIEVNSDKVRINFLKQMEYPFLLDKNPSQLFEFLSMSNDSDKLASIFYSMRSDLRTTNSSIDNTIGQIDTYKSVIQRDEITLKNYKGIDQLTDKILSYDTKVNQYTNLVELIRSIGEKRRTLLESRDKILSLRKLKTDSDSIMTRLDQSVPNLEPLSKAIQSLTEKKRILIEQRNKVLALRKQLADTESVLEQIPVEKIQSLQTLIQSLNQSLATLEGKRSVLSAKASNIESLKSQLDSVTESLSSFKSCPLCGAPLTEQHNHGGEH